jgi:dTDP-4-dehydrorhamnose 3,5-epimerase
MNAELIQGYRFADSRGELDFFNSFDLSEIVRMYRIKPADTNIIRAWQGHRHEQKWFYCLKGSFVVNLLPLSEFTGDPVGNSPQIYTLQADLQQILRIPGGYVNGFRAIDSDSELLVFSNMTLEDSKADDYRFDLEDWPFKEKY